jgi:gamma-glutamylcyclotransferase
MYYFAYSTNLNKKKMAEICPQSRPRYIATLFNYKLVFTNWARQWHGGIATIKRSTGDKVFGAIYEVPDTEWGKTGLKPKIAPEISNASKYW